MHRIGLALMAVGVGFFAWGFAVSSTLLCIVGGGAWALVLGLVIVARNKAREDAVMAALSEPPPAPIVVERHEQPERDLPVLPAMPVAPQIHDNPFTTPLEDGVRSMFDLDWSDDEEITLQRA